MKGCHGNSMETFGMIPLLGFQLYWEFGEEVTRTSKQSGAGESSVRRWQRKQRRDLWHFKGESICYDIGFHQPKLALKIHEVPSGYSFRHCFVSLVYIILLIKVY